MKLTRRTMAAIRPSQFSNTVLFLTEILNFEIAQYEKEKEFVQFKFPSGQIVAVFGSKNLWHPFTTPQIGN